MLIKDKIFLVTGAGSGLGAAVARMLADEGACVLAIDMNVAAGEKTAAELGGKARFHRADVTSEADGIAVVKYAEAVFGGIHGLVNCAGIAPGERVIRKDAPHGLDSFARTVAVNFVGTFNMLRLATSVMVKGEADAAGVRVVTIAPGIFETPMMVAMPQEMRDALGASVPFPPRLGRPDEYAGLVRHICENTMLNGEVLRLDGALRMAPR